MTNTAENFQIRLGLAQASGEREGNFVDYAKELTHNIHRSIQTGNKVVFSGNTKKRKGVVLGVFIPYDNKKYL